MGLSLVTGGAGFIGSHLVDELLAAGETVRVLDDLSNGLESNLEAVQADVDLQVGRVQDEAAAKSACQGVDTVFHLGALGSVPRSIEFPLETHDANSSGTLNILEAARKSGASRFILASSSSVYGDSPTLPKSEPETGNVLSPYALSKLTGEEYCRLYADLHGMNTTSLRFFNVFGPRQRADHVYAAVIPLFVDAALNGRPLLVNGDGSQSRDFTYVANNVAGIIATWKSSSPDLVGGCFNLACGGRITLNELVDALSKTLGQDLEVDYQSPRAGDIPHSFANTTAIETATGYRPEVSFEDGLQRTIDWFRSIGG